MSRLDFDLHRGQFRAFVSIETVDDRTVLSAHHECESWRELQPEERRALLAHLLAAEGLPGVEEIERAVCEEESMRLRAERDIAVARYQELHDALLVHLGINYDPDYGYDVECDPEERVYPNLRDAIGAVVMIDNAEKNQLRFDLAESRKIHQDAEVAASGMSDDLSEMGEKAEMYRSALEDIDNLSLERGLNHIHGFDELYYVYSDVSDAVDIVREALSDSDNDAKNSRQARLHELLEAEARERVERSELSEEDPIEEDSLSTLVTFSTDNGSIDLDVYGNATKFECEPLTITVPEADLNAEEAWDLILCLAAALAEKRRREEQAALESIPEEDWEEQYADMRRRGESEVSGE